MRQVAQHNLVEDFGHSIVKNDLVRRNFNVRIATQVNLTDRFDVVEAFEAETLLLMQLQELEQLLGRSV